MTLGSVRRHGFKELLLDGDKFEDEGCDENDDIDDGEDCDSGGEGRVLMKIFW